MSRDDSETTRRIQSLDPRNLESCLREAAGSVEPARVMDDLEVQHLVRVVTEGSLLLSDVYSEERIARIMYPDRGLLHSLVVQLVEQERRGEGEVLYRVRRLPDDLRVLGDKALFDLGISGQRQVKGYDLDELGARAYRVASEALDLLAEDRRLREFFKHNRLLVLPLEEEVVFLRQCSENFRRYVEILERSKAFGGGGLAGEVGRARRRVPLLAAAAEALTAEARRDDRVADAYGAAARGDDLPEVTLSREQLLSSYERMLLFSALDLEQLERALEAVVVDQPHAVGALCDEFRLFAAGTRDPRKPPAYFLVGPTGVGKNHLVESLCRTLEGLWRIAVPRLVIEGPNYTYPSDINELRGATRGFIRSDEDGLLTTFHQKSSRAPLAVILVDEVEKAHPQLVTFFLSILDRGTTTDNRGSVLDFANCIVFFTSNLGYSDAQQHAAPIGYLEEAQRAAAADVDVRRELRRALKPEFVNRVKLVHFERLSPRSAERILELELERIARRYREVHGLRLVLDPSAREELLRAGFSEVYGARRLAATLEAVCNVGIAKRIREDDRSGETEREALVAWLRELREGSRPFQPEEVRQRVLELAGARLDYDALRIGFDGQHFTYEPVRR